MTHHYAHAYNVSFDITGSDTMTVGANAMGVIPHIEMDDPATRQLWIAMNRAEAWCNEDLIADAEVSVGIVTGASARDLLDGDSDGPIPGLEILGDGFAAYVGNHLPGGMLKEFAMYYAEEYMKDQDEYRLVDLERLQDQVPYSILYTYIMTGMNWYWCDDDVETVAAHPSLASTFNGMRAYADKVLTWDTFDPTALDTAGYVSYVSAYESGTTVWDQFFDDDDGTELDDSCTSCTGTRGDQTSDLEWYNYQMEMYGILNAMLPAMDEDGEIYFRFALPVAAYNLAGEACMESEGLGNLLHALFKIFVYYPFDRQFHKMYTELDTEHDCFDDVEDYTEELSEFECNPGCRDQCD